MPLTHKWCHFLPLSLYLSLFPKDKQLCHPNTFFCTDPGVSTITDDSCISNSSTSRNHWKCLLIFSLGVTFPQITPYYKPTLVPASLDPREEPRTITVTQLTNWCHWIGERYYGCSERGRKARVAWERLLTTMLLWGDLNNRKKKRQPQTSVESILRSTWGSPGRLGHSGRQRWGGGSTPALLAGPSCPEVRGTE